MRLKWARQTATSVDWAPSAGARTTVEKRYRWTGKSTRWPKSDRERPIVSRCRQMARRRLGPNGSRSRLESGSDGGSVWVTGPVMGTPRVTPTRWFVAARQSDGRLS